MKTKTLIRNMVGLVVAGTFLASTARAAMPKQSPGVFDFGTVTASAAERGSITEVNLSTPLLRLAARTAEEKEPEAAQILARLKSVRVTVVGLSESNRALADEDVSKVRAVLANTGWEQVVRVQESGADLAVHFKMRGAEAVEGVVVTLFDGQKEAVLVNVVGDISPSELSQLGDRLRIQPLKRAGDVMRQGESSRADAH